MKTHSMNLAMNLDFAAIGNGQVAALIDTHATVAWFCLPRLDGDPVFNTLLGGTGRFGLSVEGQVSCEQSYARNTAVLVTTLTDEDGAQVRVTDFAPKFGQRGRDFRPMALVRRVEVVSGTPRLIVDFHVTVAHNTKTDDGVRGVSHVSFTDGETPFRMTTDAPLGLVLDGTPFVPAPETAFVITPDESLSDDASTLAREWEVQTVDYWRDWVGTLALPLDYQPDVIRAAITLRLCVYEETGGIVAALTTSLPEHQGSERNWDYRYNWIRDSYFTVAALSRLSDHHTRSHYARYLMSIIAGRCGETIQPLWGLGLEHEITEWVADALPGYSPEGGGNHAPVRIGNAAYDQLQHDVYGQVLLSLAPLWFDHRLYGQFGDDEFALMERVATKASEVWDTPDAGIWEFRSISKVHTSSAMFCWAGVDRTAKIADHLGHADRRDHWRKVAEEMRDTILDRAWNTDRKALTAAFGGEDLDASLLLMVELGMVTADDERFVATVERIDEELRSGNHVFRYINADDFGEPETAFTACTLWHIEALHRIGREDDAREMFEAVLASRNSFGLLSEDIYCKDGALWGNLPQTYCMAGIIDCARRLSRPWNAVM